VSQPDLFVVCRNCGSEVSPYVTECPYCGQRVRKRAPKIDRGGEGEEPRRRRRRPTLPRTRRGEIPGIAVEHRPYATGALIVASLLATLVAVSGALSSSTNLSLDDMGALFFKPGDQWWRVLTSPFLHNNAGYAFIALFATGIFGASLERRFGWLTPLFIFIGSGVAGAALAVAVDDLPALGANGAALGLVIAWLVEDRLALRRGDDRETDLVGAYVVAAVLLLVAVAWRDASIFAGIGGAAAGAFFGLSLAQLRR
jgi:membrane associated rhomboid family serine protease